MAEQKTEIQQLQEAATVLKEGIKSVEAVRKKYEAIVANLERQQQQLSEFLTANAKDVQRLSAQSNNLATLSSEVQLAHDKIYKPEQEGSLSVLDDILDSQERTQEMYTRILEIENKAVKTEKTLFGSSGFKRGEEIDAALITAANAADYIKAEDNYYEKVPYNTPGLVKTIEVYKGEYDSLLTRLEKFFEDAQAQLKEKEAQWLNASSAEKDAMILQIKQLMPSAMATGLASAYEEAKKSHAKQASHWRWYFLVSLVAIVGMAAFLKFGVFTTALPIDATPLDKWGSMLLTVCQMLPFEFPIIWFAFFSSTKANQHARIHEEYLHKWSLANTFVGLSNASSEIEQEVSEDLKEKLYTATLEGIRKNPGNLLDKPTPTDSPLEQADKLFKSFSQDLKEEARDLMKTMSDATGQLTDAVGKISNKIE